MEKPKKVCGNCKYWKRNKIEPNMGICTRSNPRTERTKSIPSGIAIRYTYAEALVVYFGKLFGCRYFRKK